MPTPKTPRNCKRCGKSFMSRTATFCSRSCVMNFAWATWKKRGNQKPPKKCLECGAMFKTYTKTAKYCSVKCANIVKGRNMKGNRRSDFVGRSFHNGYIRVFVEGHPYGKNNYVFEHRLVVEKSLGRYLIPNETIHHINGRKDDNRLENLEIVLRNAHYGEVDCPYCRKRFRIK